MGYDGRLTPFFKSITGTEVDATGEKRGSERRGGRIAE